MKRILFVLTILGLSLGSFAQTTAPFTQDFTGTSIPTGWTNTSSSTSANANWKFSGTPGNPTFTSSSYVPAISLDHTGNGSGSAWSDGSSPAVADCGLMTDSIDISSLTSLFFELWYYSNNITNAGDNNKLYVNFYDGTAWNDSVWSFKGDVTQWSYAGIDLSSYTTSGKVVFEIVVDQTTAGTAFYNDIMIDDVSVKNVPPCPFPLGLSVTNVTGTTADVSWGSVTAASNGYDVIHGLAGFNPASAGTVTAVTTGTTTSLSGLSGATTYDVYVVADCAANGTSDTTGPTQFITACVPFTAPYTNNFDTDALDAPPFCWEDYETNAGSFVEVEDFTFTSAPYAGPRALYLYSSSGTPSDSLWAVTPEFTDLTGGDKQINFFMNSDDPVSQLWVGTTSSQTSKTVNWIDTLPNLVPDTYAEYIVEFTTANGYNGTDTYIVLAHNMGGTFDYIRIDEFVYEDIPACPKISGLTATYASADSLHFSFTNTGVVAVDVEWGPTGFTQGTGCNANIATTSDFGISDNVASGACAVSLQAGTTYDVYVRNDCSGSANGSSVWTGPITITTAYSPPYLEDFSAGYPGNDYTEADGLGGNPTVFTSTTSSGWSEDGFSNNGFTGAAKMNIYSTQTEWMFTPLIDLGDGTTNYQIEFDASLTPWNGTTPGTMGPDDTVFVVISTDAGATWNLSDALLTIDPSTTITSGNGTHFISSLAGYSGLVQFGFYAESTVFNADNDFFVDNIQIRIPPACPAPIGLTATSVGVSSASISWSASDTVFEVSYGISPYTAGSGGTTVTVNDTFDILTGLSSQTTYDIYVRTDCGVSQSTYTGPLTITTACLTASMPYLDDLDTWPLACWNNTGSSVAWQEFVATSGSYAEANFWSNNGGTYSMISRPIDISADAQLVFDWSHLHSASYPDDQLIVMVKSMSASSWDTVLDLKGPTNFNDPTAGNSGSPGSFITEEIALSPSYTGDTIQVQFYAISDWGPDLFLNDIIVEAAPNCTKLTNLSATNISDTSAFLNWDPNSNSISYEVWLGPQGFSQGTATTGGNILTASSDSLQIDTLTQLRCYEYLVRGICAPGDTSIWAGPFVFCTLPACPEPTNLGVDPNSITINSASVYFTPGGFATDYNVVYGPTGTTPATGTYLSVTNDTVPLSGLASGTAYEFYVRDSCGAGDVSTWSGPVTFVTAFTTDYLDNFNSTLFGWERRTGKLTANTVLTGTFSAWGNSAFGNAGGSPSQRANIWLGNQHEWLLSPSIYLDPSKNLEVSFDAAITQYASTTQGIFGSDDSLAVVISTDNGATWTKSNIIWSKSGTDTVPAAGFTYVVPLTGRSGYARFGIYAGSSIDDIEDNDWFVDNFEVREIGACPRPQNLQITASTTSSLTMTWDVGTSTTTNWVIEYGTAPSSTGTFVNSTNDTATVTGLMASTSYCFKVAEICPNGDTSAFTPIACAYTDCSVFTAPYSQDFEFATVTHFDGTDACWTVSSNNAGTTSSGGYSWEVRNTSQTTSGTSTGPDRDNTLAPALGGKFYTADVSGSVTGDTTLLVSPIVNTTSLTNPELKYFYHRYGNQMAELHVDIHDGNSWNRDVHSFTSLTGLNTSQADPFKDTTISLASYSSANLRVRFRLVSNGCCAGDVAIDDVTIDNAGAAPCAAPTGLDTNNVACTSIDLEWMSAKSSSIVVYGLAGFTASQGTTVNASSPYSLTGLMPNTMYEFYVADTCGSDTSALAGPFSFTTANGPKPVASFTFSSTYGSGTQTVSFDASASTGGTSYDWDFGNSNTGTGQMASETYSLPNSSFNVTLIVSNDCGSDTITETVNTNIGLFEPDFAQSMSIFPNPSTDVFNLEFEKPNAGHMSIEIVNAAGQVIFSEDLGIFSGAYNKEIDLGEKAPGMYLLRINSDEGVITRRINKI